MRDEGRSARARACNQANLTLYIEQGAWTSAEAEDDPSDEQSKQQNIKDAMHRALFRVGATLNEGLSWTVLMALWSPA